LVVPNDSIEIKETQAFTSAEITYEAVKIEYKISKNAFIREDYSFYLAGLNFPGPFLDYIQRNISIQDFEDIVRVLRDFNGTLFNKRRY
jgi:hypothetical protein